MVLESITNPIFAKKHPFRLFLVGILFATISVIFSLWIFKSQTSLVMVFLTVTATVPLMYATMQEEEEEDLIQKNEIGILKEHSKTILFLSFLFLGFVVAFSLFAIFLPSDLAETVFSAQLDTIKAINANVAKLTGQAFDLSYGMEAFVMIFLNNVKVLLFCLFFAFFFGAGAIFILTWNASVISAAIGAYFRNGIEYYAMSHGLTKVAIYFGVFSLSLLRYMIHGSFEIVAYFIGGLAGGIISVGMINHTLQSNKFKVILFDAFTLMTLAIVILVFAGLIEVFVTPLFF